jgi:ubiquinone/menaquinone biosynthesis C-methylase UbiE
MAQSVARSLDLPPALLPHVGVLFEGLHSLGGSPRKVAGMLHRAGLAPGSRVLDLACGKGGASVELARRLGAKVLGVDACPEFIAAATSLALHEGVEERCRFRVGNVRQFRTSRPFDAALMLGLFGVEHAAPLLRSLVKPGGLYLIDDAFRVQRAARRKNMETYESVPTLGDTRRVFTDLGDDIVEELVPTRTEIMTQNQRLLKSIIARCGRLRKSNPELAPALDDFVQRQRDGNTLLQGPIRPGVWVVRKNALGSGLEASTKRRTQAASPSHSNARRRLARRVAGTQPPKRTSRSKA